MNEMNANLWNRVDATEREIVEQFVDTNPPIKIGELASKLGLDVMRSASLPPKISGLIRPSQKARLGFEILVNKYESPERQRFTVAHEVAHFLLHRDDIGAGIVDSIMYRSSLSSKKEIEANKLAAQILMPSKLVREKLHYIGGLDEPGAVAALAGFFKVSEPAMRIRVGVT